MEKAEEAKALFGTYGNCCTAVLAAYGPEFGMAKELAVRVTRGMPGIGLLGDVCGAVTGAALVIGLATTSNDNIGDTEAGFRTCQLVQQFIAAFRDRHRSTECRDLLGHDISTPEQLGEAAQANAFTVCPGYVETAVEILNTLLGESASEEPA
jgi:C_GCAxxG_C_C family probable redox protein